MNGICGKKKGNEWNERMEQTDRMEQAIFKNKQKIGNKCLNGNDERINKRFFP